MQALGEIWLCALLNNRNIVHISGTEMRNIC